MQRTAPGLFAKLESLIATATSRHPLWRTLIEPLRETTRALASPEWTDAAHGAQLQATRAQDAPTLDGATIPVSSESLARLLTALAAATGDGPGLADWRPTPVESVALVEASICSDSERLGDAGVETIAALAALPLLHACAREHASRVPSHWAEGYCPVCGAWPVFAELVGIDRSRHLRCGRCAADWPTSWLTCPYCGERDHQRLGTLVPELNRETRKVETCASCRGYIKSLATLVPSRGIEVSFNDLDTVELDIAALEHGFARPPRPGYALALHLT